MNKLWDSDGASSNQGNFQGHSIQNCIEQALENFPSSLSIEMDIGNLSCFIEICLYNFAYTIACFKGTKGPPWSSLSSLMYYVVKTVRNKQSSP